MGECRRLLGQGLALPLEQVVALLCGLELRFHQPQRLARGEDSFSGLEVLLSISTYERVSELPRFQTLLRLVLCEGLYLRTVYTSRIAVRDVTELGRWGRVAELADWCR
jgi:hypothetical protein